MNLEKYKDYSTEDFVMDDQFVSWVLNDNKESDTLWTAFTGNNPEQTAKANEAAFIVKSLQAEESYIPGRRLEIIYDNIISEARNNRKTILNRVMKYAALVMLMLSIGSLLYFLNKPVDQFPLSVMDQDISIHGRIVLSDGSSVEFDSGETIIRQTTTGGLVVNKDTVINVSRSVRGRGKELNRVIIPYGKRSEITLADGTHIWLNSGSQISYPDEFTGNSRDVYLSGEAFFDVVRNEKPFTVITKDIRIKVLGTKFNVSAYSEDQTSNTILVSGEISVGRNALLARTVSVMPGEKITYIKDDEAFTRENIESEYVNSWVYGYLVFKNEPTPEIFRKLERYYNQNIKSETGLEDITFSGKLDLSDDLGDVLENIAFASSLKIIRDKNDFIVKDNAYDNN